LPLAAAARVAIALVEHALRLAPADVLVFFQAEGPDPRIFLSVGCGP